MSDTKLKKLAQIIYENIPISETPTEFFNHFMRFVKGQESYFIKRFSVEDLLKLCLYSWSYANTKDFQWANNAILNLRYITLLIHNNTSKEFDCEKCNETGNIKCKECDGRGEIDCYDCTRKGYFNCEACNGTGCEECDDNGIFTCSSCDGAGGKKCEKCGGYGEFVCDKCDGYTWYTSGYIEFSLVYLISWSENLYLRAKYCEETRTPLMNDDMLINDYSDEYIKLYTEYEDSFEFTPLTYTLADEYYVLDVYEDFPKFTEIKSNPLGLRWIPSMYKISRYGHRPN